MKKSDSIKERINELASHFTFEYKNTACGVDPFSENDFDLWCGDNNMTAKSIDEVMTTPFFNGKSLSEIADDIEIIDF